MLQFDHALPLFHMRRDARAKKLLLINGHPDPSPNRYCSALCDAYEEGAADGGRQIKRFNIGTRTGAVDDTPADSRALGKFIAEWADQLTVIFPLWLNKPPLGLSNLFQKMLSERELTRSSLVHRHFRMIITMDMPAFAHRAVLRCKESSEDLRRKVSLAGLVADDLVFIGSIGTASDELRRDWLDAVREFGERGV